MSRAITDDEVFRWWVEQGDGYTLDEAYPRYVEWLEDVRDALRGFWGCGS